MAEQLRIGPGEKYPALGDFIKAVEQKVYAVYPRMEEDGIATGHGDVTVMKEGDDTIIYSSRFLDDDAMDASIATGIIVVRQGIATARGPDDPESEEPGPALPGEPIETLLRLLATWKD